MTYKDRLWSELVPYQPGDIVSRLEVVRRKWWEVLLFRPRRFEQVEYICSSARNCYWRRVP